MDKTLQNALDRFPLDTIVTYKGKEIGKVIGYKRANGKDDVEVIFQHHPYLASGKQGMFSLRARYYKSILVSAKY